MSQRADHSEPLPLIPVPPWLSRLAGCDVTAAIAVRGSRTVVLRANTARGSMNWEVADLSDTLRCWHINRPPQSPLRTELPLEKPFQREISRFVRRIGWVTGAGDSSGYLPTPAETQLLQVARALFSSLSQTNLTTLDARPSAVTNPWMLWANLYADLCKGRWDCLFPVFDLGVDNAPLWLKPWLVALGGNITDMRDLAAHATQQRGDLAILEGAAFQFAGFYDAALARYRVAVEDVTGIRQANLCHKIATLLTRLNPSGHTIAEAVFFLQRAIQISLNDDTLLVRVVEELIRCGAIDQAHQLLVRRCQRSPYANEVALTYAELLLWADRVDDALPIILSLSASDHPPQSRIFRVRGVAYALQRHWDDACVALNQAVNIDPYDMETHAWLGETHLHLGHRDKAAHHIAAARALSQSPVHVLLAAALRPADTLSGRAELRHVLDALGEPLQPWLNDPVAAALTAVRRFGGNRSPWLTQLVPQTHPNQPKKTSVGLGIKPVRLPPIDRMLASRNASAEMLRKIALLPIADVEQGLTQLASEYPESPHPLCYRGELKLWLGDYTRAIADFDEALSRHQARWGYVGKAAALILQGDYEAAEAMITECNVQFEPVKGATTPVYVGEMLRRRQHYALAAAELTEAVTTKPGRVGAWMNLALCRLALGENAAAQDIFDHLAVVAPRLYWDVWLTLGERPRWPIPPDAMEPLFERALSMMRGNRSSHTITYFAKDGTLRIVCHAVEFSLTLSNHAPFLGSALRTVLVAGIDL